MRSIDTVTDSEALQAWLRAVRQLEAWVATEGDAVERESRAGSLKELRKHTNGHGLRLGARLLVNPTIVDDVIAALESEVPPEWIVAFFGRE